MTVVTEPHPDGWGHRWLLLDRDTGEILCTGWHPYSTPENAEVAGMRQLHAAATLPTPDHLEPTCPNCSRLEVSRMMDAEPRYLELPCPAHRDPDHLEPT